MWFFDAYGCLHAIYKKLGNLLGLMSLQQLHNLWIVVIGLLCISLANAQFRSLGLVAGACFNSPA